MPCWILCRASQILAYAPSANGATFDWRGSGTLFFVSSHWELLGYGTDHAANLEWAVTCQLHSPPTIHELTISSVFSKTLFTPAGVDIYIRRSPAAPPPVSGDEADQNARKDLLASIVKAVQANEDEGVRTLSGKGFAVPGIV